jgi:hypothetical protein
LFSENSYEIFKLSTQGSTNYGGVKGAISSSNGTVNPLDKYQRHIDQPVFYGRGASSISYDTTSSLYNSNTDKRIFLEITDSNKFRYRFFNDSRWIQENVTHVCFWKSDNLRSWRGHIHCCKYLTFRV